MTKSVIIYHASCPDGWGSAWWLGKWLGPHIKHAANYDDRPPLTLCWDAEVYVVDFCYDEPDMAEIARLSSKLTVLDHHETADLNLIDWGRTDATTAALTHDMEIDDRRIHAIVIDQDHSGVGLVDRYVRARWADEEPNTPRFLANIEDRDLWRFKLPDTKHVFAAVTSRPYDEDEWDSMAMTPHAQLVGEGAGISRYRDQLIAQVAASTFDIWLSLLPDHSEQILVPCASSPYAIGSDVAGRLAEESTHGVGAYCILHEENIQIGLRSRGGGPNVADIAAHYGGGGHPAAAGLRVPWNFWHLSMKAIS